MYFKHQLTVVFICLLVVSASAEETLRQSYLTAQQVQQVKEIKGMLDGVDAKSLHQTIAELEKTRYPQVHLEMMQAMARTYMDIAHDFGVDSLKKKEWLYSMVCLNMAYLQFGGDQGKPGSTTELNRLIRQKLKAYLPADILKQREFLNKLS